jgi:hypothetical protein
MDQLHDSDGGGDGNLGQMRFGQAKVARATSSHGAHALPMGPESVGTMAIGVFEDLCALTLACRKQGLHALSWLQGQGAPSRSGARSSAGTRLTIGLREFHLDDGFAFGILSRCPA